MPPSVSMSSDCVLALTLGAATPVLGVTPPVTTEHGYQFVTICDVWNAPVPHELVGGLNSAQEGRGSVGYEYRMATTEVSTTEWVEFMDVVARFDPHFARTLEPFSFGGVRDKFWSGPGERWYSVPGYERIPVLGMSWRNAAMYCNWLHNDKAPTMAALMDGAYDTSTFTSNPDGTFNDQLTHSPSARFWIPTLDEWLKASHYDPDRSGAGQGGWWLYPYASDTPPVSGWPDEPGAQTSRGALDRYGDEGHIVEIPDFDIPIGAYADADSPWGLFDISGGASEWTEHALSFEGLPAYARSGVGSWVGAGDDYWDRLGMFGGGGTPDFWSNRMGLRLAMRAVPNPGVLSIASLFGVFANRRGTRSPHREE